MGQAEGVLEMLVIHVGTAKETLVRKAVLVDPENVMAQVAVATESDPPGKLVDAHSFLTWGRMLTKMSPIRMVLLKLRE